MSSSVEMLEGLKRRLKISIPTEVVEKAYQQRLRKVASTANIKGFRVGKVPPSIIEKRFGSGVRKEVADELMQENIQQAVQEQKLQIAGAPKLSYEELSKDKPYECSIEFEVYPEIVLKSLEGLELERLSVDVTDQDIDVMLDKLALQQAEWQEVDRVAENQDKVTIDFVGTLDGTAFEGGTAQGFELELGANQMIPGFEEGIIGMKVGDVKDLPLKFPDNYHSEQLKSKNTVFKITLHKVTAAQKPPIDDIFAEKLGVKGGLDALRQEAKKNMLKESEQILREKLKQDVLRKLVEVNPIQVPSSLVEYEINHLQDMTRQQIAQRTQKPSEAKEIPLPRDPYIIQAQKRVILGLLLSEFIKKHQIKADADKVRAHIEELAASYHKPEEVISWYYSNSKMLSEVESIVLESQAVERLESELTIEDKSISYEEAIKQAKKLNEEK